MNASNEKASAVAEMLNGRTLGCAESCTAGAVVQAFAAVELASNWLRGGVIAYQFEVKRRRLGVQAESMYSEQCAAEMAFGAAAMFDAEVTVATTGVIGSEPEDGVAPGTIFIGTFVDGDVVSRQHRFDLIGDAARQRATEQALDDLLAHLRSVGHARSERVSRR